MRPIKGGMDTKSLNFSKEERLLIDIEVNAMLKKNAIERVTKTGEPGRVISNIFIRDKKDGGQRPIINLKRLNSHIQYQHFKMEGIHSIRDLLRPNDLLVKIDLKDAFFSIPIDKASRKLTTFHWKGETYEFKVLCF